MHDEGVGHAAGGELEVLWTGFGGVGRDGEGREGEGCHLEGMDGLESGVGAEAEGGIRGFRVVVQCENCEGNVLAADSDDVLDVLGWRRRGE